MTTELLETLEYVAATLKLRHIDEATDDEVEEALTMAQEAVAAAQKGQHASPSAPVGKDTGLLAAAKAALADLQGIMPEFEPSGDRLHPAWKTINELETAIEQATVAEGKHASSIQAKRNSPLDALQAILPYAERELESLDECQRRDGGLEDEVAACEAAVENAQRMLKAARGKA